MDCCSSASDKRRGLSVRTIIILVAVVLTIGILVAGCADRASDAGSHGGGHGGHSSHGQ